MDVRAFFVRYRIYILTVVVALLALFYLRDDVRRLVLLTPGQEPALGDQITCTKDRFTTELLAKHASVALPLQVLVHFQDKPSADAISFFQINGVALQPNSWIYDYMVAETDVSHVCFLATVPGVTKVDAGQ